jgi:hypothetical protein
MARFVFAVAILWTCTGATAAAQLKPETAAAFDRYVRLSEAAMAEDIESNRRFIWTQGLDDSKRRAAEATLRRGEVVIERPETRDRGKRIDVPDGMIHHWVGIVFVPGATAKDIVRLLQDYDSHARIFAPNVVRSRTLWQKDGRFGLFLRFHMKKVLSVTLNTESEATFYQPGPTRTYSQIRSTRIAEVEDAGTPREREKPVGNDSGFMWRLNTYWRVQEETGGTYVQCESITLSRDIPFGLGWIIGPFVTDVPRESLQFTLGKVLFAARKSLPAR